MENKIPVGLVRYLPDASSAWAEVERLHVRINRVDVRRGMIFGYTHAVSRDRMVAAGKMLTAILSHAPDKNGLTAD